MMVNRECETLDLVERGPDGAGAAGTVARISAWADKFEPRDEFEEAVAGALGAAEAEAGEGGGTDTDGDDGDDLGQGRLTIEEYAQRRAELAKARSLLFDEGRRRQRLNKIKSKTYRSIRKRQISRRAENGVGSDDDDADEAAAREKAEADRAKERMTLQHKNTSRWAKRVLRRGKHNDKDTRIRTGNAVTDRTATTETTRRKYWRSTAMEMTRPGTKAAAEERRYSNLIS